MKFIDLFAGCGMLRLAFQQAGHTCVGGCEIDKFARRTYAVNLDEFPEGKDICEYRPSQPFDILCGGFPCQPFSNMYAYERRGFKDVRGTLYKQVIRILQDCKPEWYFLENVPGLVQMKECFAAIEKDITSLGYSFQWQVIDAALVWPQRRKRVYMIGRRSGPYEFPVIKQKTYDIGKLFDYKGKMIGAGHWEWICKRKERFGLTGGFAHQFVEDVCPTLTTTYGDKLFHNHHPRPIYLSVRERARMMGLPERFVFPVSQEQALKQIGNGVVVPLVRRLAESITEVTD